MEERIISTEYIRKYVIPIEVNGVVYEPILRYVGPEGDCSCYEVGFAREGVETKGQVFLPSVRSDGMFQRNRVVWYPISLVIPPMRYTKAGQQIYLSGVISGSAYALRIDDFFPGETTVNPRYGFMTPLAKELLARGGSLDNLWSWTVLTPEAVLVEVFNTRIRQDIAASCRAGFLGVNITPTAMLATMRSMMRYTSSNNEWSDNNDLQYDEDEIALRPFPLEDKQGALVLHKKIEDIIIAGDLPIDFCTCSPSKPLRTGRMRDGVRIEDHLFAGTPCFPYCTVRRATVGITYDDPHRVIVSKSVHRALALAEPSQPFSETEYVGGSDCLALPGVRLTDVLNTEDGIIVSEEFARRMGAFKTRTDRLHYDATAGSVAIVKQQTYPGDLAEAREVARTVVRGQAPYVVAFNDVLAVKVYQDQYGHTVTKEFRSTVRVPSILVAVEEFTPAGEPLSNRVVRFVQVSYYPLAIGDKVADGHGNKATVSEIWPEERMPIWQGIRPIRAHYIATPYCMKRMALGAEVEDKLSLLGAVSSMLLGEHRTTKVDSSDMPSIDEIDEELASAGISYLAPTDLADSTVPDVPLSYRRMYRLDNIAAESSVARVGTNVDDFGRTSRNTRMGLDIVVMLSRGANALVHHLIERSGSKLAARNTMVPLLYALEGRVPSGAQTYRITRKLPRAIEVNGEMVRLLGRSFPISVLSQEVLLEGTTADPRSETMYGVFPFSLDGANETIVVPPHRSIVDLTNGMAMFSARSVSANRVVAEVDSATFVGDGYTRWRSAVATYRRQVTKELCGMEGVIRDTAYPVFPCTIMGVASACDLDDPMVVMLPRSKFRYIMRNNEEVSYLYGNERNDLVLVKRDPVHTQHSIKAMRYRLWDNETIGMSPLVIGSFQGDFDGDRFTVMLADSLVAYTDFRKLAYSFAESYVPPKQLQDIEHHLAVTAIRRRHFASSFQKPHATDVAVTDAFGRLSRQDPAEILRMAIAAAQDFHLVKAGTAQTGATALRFIYTRSGDEATLLADALELYHVLAQNTLNAKAGTDTPSLSICALIASRAQDREARIRSLLHELGYDRERCIEEFLRFGADVRDTPKHMAGYLVRKAPICAAAQRIVNSDETMPMGACVEIAKRVLNGTEPLGRGIWETMIDYLLDRSLVSFYDWSTCIDDLVQALQHRDREVHDPVLDRLALRARS